MNEFLKKKNASFFHITTFENWNKIQKEGLYLKNKRIYVSNSSDLPVLFSIAMEQLPEIYDVDKIVVLKLSQEKNNFTIDEILPDTEAAVEWTQPMQNIILRERIPVNNIELYKIIEFGENDDDKTLELTRLSSLVEKARIKFEKKSIEKDINDPNHTNHPVQKNNRQMAYHVLCRK